MLAHALLAVITANEHTTRPTPDGLIALTCNEIRRLLIVLVVDPRRVLACPDPGRAGVAVTSTAPAPATTSAKKQSLDSRNDLRLEYQGVPGGHRVDRAHEHGRSSGPRPGCRWPVP